MAKVKCKNDCPKGGLCPREIKGTKEGALYVENHFMCAWVQKFIVDMAGRVVLEKNKH